VVNTGAADALGFRAVVGRVARYEIDPNRCDEAVDSFLEAAREIAQLPGFEGGYVMIDSENGAIMTWTLWENHASMEPDLQRPCGERPTES
jgi:heme-degrading monooxygenase HmoA